MAWEQLTVEEQAAVQDYVRNLRALVGELGRVRNRAAALDNGYANIQGLLAELGANDVVPDGTGLAGALPLEQNEVITLTAHAQALLAEYGAGHLQMWAKAAGAMNLIC